VPAGVPAGLLGSRNPLQPAKTSIEQRESLQISRLVSCRCAIRAANNASKSTTGHTAGYRGLMRNEPGGGTTIERAFVTTVAFDVVPLADGVTEAGERVHVEFSGAPEQVKATGETNPFRPVTVTAKVVVPPAATVAEVGATVRLNGAVDEMPVPVRAAVCGELASLSATLSVAVSTDAVLGVKVTLMVQLAATASVVPQVVVWAKDEDDVPTMVMAMPVTVAALLLVRVTVLGALVVLMVWLPKSTVVGFRNTVAGAAVPVPVRETV